jgi:hypothetical protein
MKKISYYVVSKIINQELPEFPSESLGIKINGEEEFIRPEVEEMISTLLLNNYILLENKDGCCSLFINCCGMFDGIGPTKDIEPLPTPSSCVDNEVWSLYDQIRLHSHAGIAKWVALKRSMLPVKYYIDLIRDEGIWSKDLDALGKK